MKKILFLLLIVQSVYAQPPGEWMWIHGTNVPNDPGNFGVQGVPAPTNTPPALYEACEWTDQTGNFWLFGGYGSGGIYAALWRYEPLTNQWTWMKGPNTTYYAGDYGVQGVPSPTNDPPSRSHGAATWVDLQGDLWMGFGASGFSDLWRYHIATNEWTWMKGPNILSVPGVYGVQGVPDPANNPGYRWECAVAWTDNAGDLWLLGGYGGSGMFNDMWRFNIATNNWTWMKGSDLPNQPGVYGTMNVESPLNTPGARLLHCRWKGNDGKLWFFGGSNYLSTFDNFNDLWRFDVTTNNWTWVNGFNFTGSPGIYGTRCSASNSNQPPAVFENRAAWTDPNGNLWFFGGAIDGFTTNKNNLWMYCVATNQWTWISGDTITGPSGDWGTINVPSPTNKPSGRIGSLGWTDNNGHLYMFGGADYNDLWRYTIDPNCYPCNQIAQPFLVTASNDVSICSGGCTNISATATGGVAPYTYSWTPSIGTGPGPYQVCPSVTTTYYVTATDSAGNSSSDSVTVTVNPLPVILTSSPPSICVGDSAVLTASGASTYSWLPCTDLNPCTGSAVTASPAVTTPYTVTGTDANGCSATASIIVTVNPLPLVVSPAAPAVCSGGSLVLTMSGASFYHWSPQTGLSNPNGPDSTTVTATLTSPVTYTVTGYSAEGCSASITFTVNILPNPVAVITPDGPLSFCSGEDVILTASGGTSFLWSNSSASASITVNTTGTYTVTVTDNNSCSASTSETVTVHPLPVAVISPAGPVLICSSTPATLTASTGPGYTYQWYQNNTLLPGEVNSTLTVSITGDYTVFITDANGCTATSSPVQVMEGLGPDVTITSSPGIGCLQNTIYIGYGPQSITLTAVSTTAVSYLWSTSAVTQSISVTASGTYSVTAYDANGCPSVNTPESQITIDVVDIRCGHGKKKILLCHVPEGNPGNPQTLCLAPSAIPPHLALHQYDCLGPCSLYYPRMSPVEDDEATVLLYPNPFSNTFIVSVENTSGAPVLLNLYDVTGRIILSNYRIVDTDELGADLNNGVYSVEILIGNRREMYRIVKL